MVFVFVGFICAIQSLLIRMSERQRKNTKNLQTIWWNMVQHCDFWCPYTFGRKPKVYLTFLFSASTKFGRNINKRNQLSWKLLWWVKSRQIYNEENVDHLHKQHKLIDVNMKIQNCISIKSSYRFIYVFIYITDKSCVEALHCLAAVINANCWRIVGNALSVSANEKSVAKKRFTIAVH